MKSFGPFSWKEVRQIRTILNAHNLSYKVKNSDPSTHGKALLSRPYYYGHLDVPASSYMTPVPTHNMSAKDESLFVEMNMDFVPSELEPFGISGVYKGVEKAPSVDPLSIAKVFAGSSLVLSVITIVYLL